MLLLLLPESEFGERGKDMGNNTVDHVVWRLEDIYLGMDDPQREVDREWCRRQARFLAETYRGRVAGLSPEELRDAVRLFEEFSERLQKLSSYAQLSFATRTEDAAAGALLQEAVELESELNRDTLFFELEWKQLEEEKARELLDDQALVGYRHFLSELRKYRPHTLTEPEERILAETAPVGSGSWSTLFDKVMGALRFGESGRTQSAVLGDLYLPERETRKRAAGEFTDGLLTVRHIAAHIFNTVLLDRSIEDRLRSHPHWLNSRNLSNEIDDRTVDALVQAVTSRYDIVHRYYALKANLLGLERLNDYDRYAPLPGADDAVFTWEQSRDIVLDAYREFSPAMADVAERFFQEKWIHAPALPGKRAGAFSHSAVPSLHPYIMMNFTGKQRDVSTLAHELGHGIHQFMAREQGLFNGRTPLTMAETASVFGELLVFRRIVTGIADRRQVLALLCSRLEDEFATIFRQVAMNRFEHHTHTERRAKGELSPERFSEIWLKTQGEMLGDAVELTPNYGVWWSYIPHFIHAPGYVYAYAFGNLLVLALSQKYRVQGEGFVALYLELLRSGGNNAPRELLAPLGIRLDDPDFWRQGLDMVDEMVREAEHLAAD